MITTNPVLPSSAQQTNHTATQIDQDIEMKEMDSEEQPKVVKRPFTQIYVCSKGKTIRITGKEKLKKRLDQQKVTIQYSVPYLRFY